MAPPISPDESERYLRRLNSDAVYKNLRAQSDARYILYETFELEENFPQFDEELDEKVTSLCFLYLDSACAVLEQRENKEARDSLSAAGAMLVNVHGSVNHRSEGQEYALLIAALAFYVAGQYSRAFVCVRNLEFRTRCALLVSTFLKRDFGALISLSAEIILEDIANQRNGLEEDGYESFEAVFCYVISLAFANLLEFVYTGNDGSLQKATEVLKDAMDFSAAGNSPCWWWIARLLRLLFLQFGNSSPWKVLPTLLDNVPEMDRSIYLSLLPFLDRPVTELWQSQIAVLPKALGPDIGTVVSLRTSAGKTRVAEVAMVKALSASADARILYIAPFRSLAIEVESTFNQVFGEIGFHVSHLYGGSRVSNLDTALASESRIIIATPEKARALMRASPEIAASIKLYIVDEGHLLGNSDRYIRNEVFIDHIRTLARTNGAKVLLLSAVLPNANVIAQWLSGSEGAAAESTWTPSGQRRGLLLWNGQRVQLEWIGEQRSFNRNFAERQTIGTGRRARSFPRDKNEAIAETAIRLSAVGPVLIFTGLARSVPTFAKALLRGLGGNDAAYPWPRYEWQVFEAVCSEYLEDGAIEWEAAKRGVICHSAKLPSEVRLAMERLMRSRSPRVVVATTTLGQGVNLGVSSVIVANAYVNQELISKRDFWNIAGRAGRAFVDGEGKILFAVDETGSAYQRRKQRRVAEEYLTSVQLGPVQSGVLYVLNRLKEIAEGVGIEFDRLLELVAENDFSAFGDKQEETRGRLDLIDDELLSMHLQFTDEATLNDRDVTWVDDVFRTSLSVLQAGDPGVSEEEAIGLIRSRVRYLSREFSEGRISRAQITSGLPLRSASQLATQLDRIGAKVQELMADTRGDDALIEFASFFDEIAQSLRSFFPRIPSASDLEDIRRGWLTAVPLKDLPDGTMTAKEICAEYYSYLLPWLMHATSHLLRGVQKDAEAEVLDQVALLVEIGVATPLAAKLYLLGIRSRMAVTEIASRLPADVSDYGIGQLGSYFRRQNGTEQLRTQLSSNSVVWLELIVRDRGCTYMRTEDVPGINLTEHIYESELFIRTCRDAMFLCTADYNQVIVIDGDAARVLRPFANDPSYVLRKGEWDKAWTVRARNPRYLGLGTL